MERAGGIDGPPIELEQRSASISLDVDIARPPMRRRVDLSGRGGAAGELSRLSAIMIVLGLVLFLLVKIEFRMPHSSTPLYLYGVTVTTVILVQMYVALWRYRDAGAPERHGIPDVIDVTDRSMVVRPPLVSCLVAVHNEEKIIEQCIHSLASQTYAAIEIIIVDDASTDETAARLEELSRRYPLVVVTMPRNVGKKRALAAGMLQSHGEVFAFSDSDSVWAPEALERCVQVLAENSDVGAVSGHCRALNADQGTVTRIQDTWYEGQFSVRKAFESFFGAVTCVSGPLAVFRREAIFNYIPAWETDRFLGREFRFATDRTLTGFVLMDARTAERVRKFAVGTAFLDQEYPWRRWRILYCKSARAWTVVPPTFKALLRQQVRWKKSFIRNLFFTGRFYWRQPLLAALVYYLHALFVFAGPLVAFRHLVYLPLHGNLESMVLYVIGILLVGSFFGLAFRREDPLVRDRWFYRPVMSLLSTVVLSWLIVYSLLTIRKMTWARS